MKRTFKKAISVFLVVAMLLCAVPLNGFVGLDWTGLFNLKAQAITDSGTCGDLTWSLDGTILKINGNGPMPDFSQGSSPWYRYANGHITSVIIGDGVTSIGDFAFWYCEVLTSVDFGDSVTRIGRSAFFHCKRLKNIIFPDTVTSIGNSALSSTSFYSDESNWDNSVLYCGNHVVNSKTSTIVGECSVREGTLTLAEHAFSSCEGLTSIILPDSVVAIGDSAFLKCTGLKNIALPDSITSIGFSAFSGTGYFNDETNWADGVLYIGKYLIEAKGDVVSGDYSIRSDTLAIAKSAFSYCWNLTGIKIPTGITYIDDNVFRNCSKLSNITIPDSVTSIGKNVFYDCTGLTSVTIPASLTFVGADAFASCSALEVVFYSGDIIDWCSIDVYDSYSSPMYYADNLYIGGKLVEGDLVIPDGVISISPGAFSNCDITSVTIPNSVTSICEAAFYNCTELTSVVIPDNVVMVGHLAFDSCTGLKNVSIGKSVKSLGNRAFSNCTGLTDITLPDSLTSIGLYAFEACTGITSVVIPDGVISIGTSAFEGCTKLTSIIIPDTVTTIGNYAFYNCTKLKAVYFKGTADEWIEIDYSPNVWSSPRPTIYYNYHEHIAGEWETKTEPTCASEGLSVKKCTICQLVLESKAIPKTTEHNYAEEITTSPTCTTAGEKTFSCICGDSYTEMIPATGHSLKRVTVAPTCSEEGKNFYQCQNCFAEFNVVIVPAAGHTPGEWETLTDSNCTDDGISIKKCTVCHAELETKPIPAAGHTPGEWETKTEATCTDDGISIKKCTVCHAELETKPIPAAGHTPGEWETLTDSNCTDDGISIKKCTVCHAELETKPILATGHTPGEWEVVAEPTCTEDGLSSKKCTVCQIEVETQVVPASGHSYESEVIKAPTCKAIGERKHTCHCGDSYTEVLQIADHDLTRYYTEPTCLEPGMEYYICNSCGNMVGDMEIIPETGHIYEWVVDTTPTATENGSKTQHCTGCYEAGETEIITATGFEPINGMVVDYADNTIYGLAAGIDSLDSYTEIVANGYEWVYEPGQHGFGTGSKAILKNDDEIIGEYTVIIFGDVQGDGWYDADDAFFTNLIVAGLLPQENLPDYMRTAADCNHDGEINELDFDLLINASVLLDDVDQSATQPELATQTAYIEYMSIIDQSVSLEVDDTAPETDKTVESAEPAEDFDFGSFLAQIFLFIRKIFNLVFSFVIK